MINSYRNDKMSRDDKRMIKKLQGWYRVTAYRDHDKTPQGWKRAIGMIKITGTISIYKNDNELQRVTGMIKSKIDNKVLQWYHNVQMKDWKSITSKYKNFSWWKYYF